MDPLEPIKMADESIRKIITRVLVLEKEKLYQDKPHVIEDIKKIVEEEIR